MISPKQYRDREILKLVEDAFIQFNITDPNEKRDISNSIKQQLDTSKPISDYQEAERADSSVYRSNVRNAMIDIISHLLHIKDLELRLNQIEGISRDMIDSAMKNLLEYQSMLIKVGGKIKESFTEGIDHGKYTNTIVKEDVLRVDYSDIKASIEDISIVTFPTESVFDGVTTSTSDNEEVLIKTGIGSDLFHAHVTSSSRPSIYVDESFFQGVVLTATLKTEDFIPAAISSKAGSSYKIALWEGYNQNTLEWDVLGKDNSFGYYSYIDTNSTTVYNKYKVTMLFSEYTISNNYYIYDAILYNIKLFKKDPMIPLEKGTFVSHLYPCGDYPLYKVNFDAKYSGYATFRIKFEGSDDTQFVLPKGENDVRYAFYNTDTEPATTHPLPFHWYSGNENLSVRSSDGSLLDYTIGSEPDGSYPYISINGVVGSSASGFTGYVLITYDALKHRYLPSDHDGSILPNLHRYLNPDLHSAMTLFPKPVVDFHDKLDGFVFPLSRVPWRVQGEETFTFFLNSGYQILATEIFPIGGEVEFNDEEYQFYYYKKKLYTNFNLLTWSNLRVNYESMSTGVKVIIDLYGDAKVDDYYLEFIEASEPVVPLNVDMQPQTEPDSPTPDDEEGGGTM